MSRHPLGGVATIHTKPEVSRWLSKAEVIARYGITQRTLERWVRSERFPAADLHLPGGQPRWSDTAIEAHERAAVGKKTAPS